MSLSGDAEVLQWLPKALFVWVVMCAIFSIAAYGLSEYHWYLIGGLATTTLRFAVLARKKVSEESQVEPVRIRPGSRPAFRGSRAPVQTFPSGSKVGP